MYRVSRLVRTILIICMIAHQSASPVMERVLPWLAAHRQQVKTLVVGAGVYAAVAAMRYIIKNYSCAQRSRVPLVPTSTFTDWVRCCEGMMINGESAVNLSEFIDAFQSCATVIKQNLTVSSNWYQGQMPSPTLFDCARMSHFQPFTQKLVIENTAQLFLWGDLHGDVGSLLRTLQVLRQQGKLNDDWTLNQEEGPCYCIWLGDYVDRGRCGIETWYTLMRLKIANPQHVLLVRGNHEDQFINMQNSGTYCFDQEIQEKFPHITPAQKNALYRFYDLLPTAIYICSRDGNTMHAMQGCHGGFELGYNPRQFLEDQSTTCYHLVGRVNRAQEFEQLPEPVRLPLVQNPWFATIAHQFKDFIPVTPTNYFSPTSKEPGLFGHMWSDFEINPSGFFRFIVGRGFRYNKLAADALLAQHSTAPTTSSAVNAVLHGLLRAHQHNGDMLDLIHDHGGVYALWQDGKRKFERVECLADSRTGLSVHRIPLWHGIIYTLFSSPSMFEDIPGAPVFDSDSFCQLFVRPRFEDWRMQHITRLIPDA